MGITYAGTDLLYPDPEGTLQRWLDDYLPLEEVARHWGLWPCTHHQQDGGMGLPKTTLNERYKVPFPQVNWPPPPKPRLNSVYRPTGLTRWGMGWFVVDTARLLQIEAYLAGSPSEILTITEDHTGRAEEGQRSESFRMWMLPPLPLTATRPAAGTDRSDLWLLLLVDVRYWWNRTPFWSAIGDPNLDEQLQDPDNWTWTDLITHCFDIWNGGTTGMGLRSLRWDDVSYEYLYPCMDELIRNGVSKAAVMEAVFWSVGLRPVLFGDFGIDAWGYVRASNIEAANAAGWPVNVGAFTGAVALGTPPAGEPYEGGYHQVAGGAVSSYVTPSVTWQHGAIPKNILVTFNRPWPTCYGDLAPAAPESGTPEVWVVAPAEFPYYRETAAHGGTMGIHPDPCPITTPGLGGACEAYKTIIDTAIYTAAPPGLTDVWQDDENSGELGTLTSRIAADYLGYQLIQYDATFSGIKTWYATGYTDYVLYSYGPAGATTRVVTLPPTVGVAAMLHRETAPARRLLRPARRVTLQRPDPATLEEGLPDGPYLQVQAYWDGYDPDPDGWGFLEENLINEAGAPLDYPALVDAEWDDMKGKYRVLAPQPEGKKYVKTDALWTEQTNTPTLSALATIQVKNPSTGAWEDSDADPIEIYMPPWLTSWVVPLGTVLEVEKHVQSGQWIVQNPPLRHVGKLDALWSSSTATLSVWAGGEDTTADLTVSMTAWLPSWVLPSGAYLEIAFDRDVGEWIVQDPILELRGVLDEELESGSSATVSIWAGGEDTTENLTAYAPARLSSGSIDSGKEVRLAWDRLESHWEVDSAEC
jgi:hypothetical protein